MYHVVPPCVALYLALCSIYIRNMSFFSFMYIRIRRQSNTSEVRDQLTLIFLAPNVPFRMSAYDNVLLRPTKSLIVYATHKTELTTL